MDVPAEGEAEFDNIRVTEAAREIRKVKRRKKKRKEKENAMKKIKQTVPENMSRICQKVVC